MPTRDRDLHDFSGNKQDKDFYQGDLVFHNGAWITKRQRKQAVRDEKEAKQYRTMIRRGEAARNAPPAPPTAPLTTAPILTGSLAPTPTPPTPAPAGQVPSWWINQAIQNPTDPNQQFANVANALLPTLSPEDQRTLATYLATNFKDVYGKYATTDFGTAPVEITDAMRQKYLSPQRAQQALGLLDKMKAASGAQNMGAGYDFLRNAISLINQFLNPNGVLGREHYTQFTNAVSSLVGQANSNKDLAAYGNLAQLFNLPKFTAGPLVSNTPNDKLFR